MMDWYNCLHGVVFLFILHVGRLRRVGEGNFDFWGTRLQDSPIMFALGRIHHDSSLAGREILPVNNYDYNADDV
jgi:hypothetical protein